MGKPHQIFVAPASFVVTNPTEWVAYHILFTTPLRDLRASMNKPLLSLYEQVDLDAAATQAAILEEVTYTKILATGAKQGLTTAKGAVKWVANWAGVRAKIDTTPAKTTQELVVDRTKWWSQRNVRDVRKFVVKTLAERLQVDEHDLGTMSTRLIEEAAAGMDVPSDLLWTIRNRKDVRSFTSCSAFGTDARWPCPNGDVPSNAS
jgi:hypothetical protein